MWAILGEIARNYNNQVSLNLFNAYLRDYSLPEINQEQLNHLIGEISVKDSEAQQVYQEIKSGHTKLNVMLGYIAPEPKHTFVNTKQEVLSVPEKDLDQVVAIIDEFQKQSPSHAISWHKVKKIALENDLIYSDSKSYRKLILHKLDTLHQTPTTKMTPQTKQFLTGSLGDELGILQVKRRANQNEQRNLNKLKRQLTDQTIFKQYLLDAIQQPQVIKEKTLSKQPLSVNDQTSLVIITSDWHIGADVQLNNNVYNVDIATKRVNEYLDEMASAIKQNHPKTVFIVNLGDLIENVQMRKNQAFTTELNLSEQIKIGTELQDSMLRSLASSFPKINFKFTELAGNHDRFAPNSKDSLNGDSVALVARLLAQTACADLSNVEVITPDNEYRHIQPILGHNIAFVHGDLDRLNDNNSLAKVANYENTNLDALIGGHLHSLMIKENNGYIIQSGSLIGPTDYSNRLALYSGPSQVILKVTPDKITPSIINL